MKSSYLVTLGILIIGFNAHSTGLTTRCSQESAKIAARLLVDAEHQEEIGTLAPLDVLRAKLVASEMKYCAGKTTLDAACKELIPTQKEVLQAETSKYKIGASTMSTLGDELRRLASYEESCKTVN